MFKGTSKLTLLRLETIWTRTGSIFSAFLIPTNWFLVLINGSIYACSTAGSSATEKKKLSETELFRIFPRRHSIVAH